MSREREPLPQMWGVNEDGTTTPLPRQWTKKPGPPVHLPASLRLVEIYDPAKHLLAIVFHDGDDVLIWSTGHTIAPGHVLLADGIAGLVGFADEPGLRALGSPRSVLEVGCRECRATTPVGAEAIQPGILL